MKRIYRVDIEADERSRPRQSYVYYGTAGSPEIAIRKAKQTARKDGLYNPLIESVHFVGNIEF